MSNYFTIVCPHCQSTTTVQTGVSKNGGGVGQYRNCSKIIKVTIDGKGNVIRVN